MSRKPCCGICFSITGLILFSVALFLPTIIDNVITEDLKKELVLTESSHDKVFREWKDNSIPGAVPLYYTTWAFNVTNAHEVLDEGAKPKLQKIGPFRYREYKVRFNLTFGTRHGRPTLKYREYKYFKLDSTFTQEDPHHVMITTLNMPLQVIYGNLEPLLHGLGVGSVYPNSSFTDYSRFFTTRSVHDILWGYPDAQMTELHNLGLPFPARFPGVFHNSTSMDDAYLNTGDWGFFTGGEDSPSRLRELFMYDGHEYLPYWGTEEANRITGTDATQFPWDVPSGRPQLAFVDDIMRWVLLSNPGGRKMHSHGIELLRFELDGTSLYNCSFNKVNCPFHMRGPSGVVNLTAAAQNVPVFLSKPNFLDVEGKWEPASKVDGLQPADRERDDTYIGVEPITGAVMAAKKQLQVNVHTHPIVAEALDAKLKVVTENWFPRLDPETLWPVAVADEHGSITASKAKDFRHTVYTAEKAKVALKWAGYILGEVAILLSVIVLYTTSKKAEKQADNIQSAGGWARLGGEDPVMN